MSNNISDKLADSFAAGTKAKDGLKKASSSAKSVALGVFFFFAVLILIFGVIPEMKEWWTNESQSNPTGQSSPQVVVQPPAMVVHPGRATEDGPTAEIRVGITYREVTSKEEPLVLKGRSGFCVNWNGIGGPDSPTTFVVYVQGVNHKEWTEWHEYRRLRAEKRSPFKNPGWFKFVPVGDTAEVYYEFRMTGQCT